MKRMVREPKRAAFSASTITCLISLMPERTAENWMKVARVVSAMIFARVVLPTPGGPQKIIDAVSSRSIWTRSGLPGARRCCWPTNSSSVRGRMRSASGAVTGPDWPRSGVGSKRLMASSLAHPSLREGWGTRKGWGTRSCGYRGCGSLSRGFVQQDAAGYGGVERFDRAGTWDGDAAGGATENFRGDAAAFVAEDEGGGAGEVVLREGFAFSGDGGQGCDLVALERGEDFVFTGSGNGQTKDRSGGGAQGFLVPRADGAGQGDEPSSSEGLGGADESAEVAGVLQGGGDEQEGDSPGVENLVEGERRRFDECGDTLWRFGADGARKDIRRQGEDFCGFGEVQVVEQILVSDADEDGGEVKAAGDGFQEKMLALDGDTSLFRSGGTGESGTQFLDPRVLPTLYNAW